MIMGRVLGFERPEAVRFAFLLSIPSERDRRLQGLAGVRQPAARATSASRAGSSVLSAVAGILAIAFLMVYLGRAHASLLVRALPRRCSAPYLLYVVYVAAG